MSIRRRKSREWVIRAPRPGVLHLWEDVLQHRGMLSFVATYTVLQIYRKAFLGVAWLVIRPLITIIGSIFVVGKVLGVSTEPVPLLLFVTVGISLWTLIKAGLKHGARAIGRARRLTRRLAIPQVLFVLGSLAPALIEFAVAFLGALAVLAYFSYKGVFVPTSGLSVVAIVPVLVGVITLVVAVSCVTAVLKTIASDVALGLNYATSLLLVVTPAVYPLSAVPQPWQWLFLLNPLAPAMEMWRWALLGMPAPPWWSVATAATLTIILLLGGLSFLSRWEQKIVDQS